MIAPFAECRNYTKTPLIHFDREKSFRRSIKIVRMLFKFEMFFVLLEINVHYSNTVVVKRKIDIEEIAIKTLHLYEYDILRYYIYILVKLRLILIILIFKKLNLN